METNSDNKAAEVIDQFLTFLDIDAKIEVEEREDSSSYIRIKSTDDSLLIGYHGNTLNSLQHIVNTILFKEFGLGHNVVIDVADYRKEREDKILDVAEKAADKARFLEKPVSLYPMSGYERKLVHQKVAELDGVTSTSQGEGENRRIVIHLEGYNLEDESADNEQDQVDHYESEKETTE